MSKNKSPGSKPPGQNPVAKYASRFNHSAVHADKTRYRRKAKHKGAEPFLIRSIGTDEKMLGAQTFIADARAKITKSSICHVR